MTALSRLPTFLVSTNPVNAPVEIKPPQNFFPAIHPLSFIFPNAHRIELEFYLLHEAI
jgi:hypothetical protein